MQCPDCGSGRRIDGYHREGWYWLGCDRRYNPDTGEYSPENNWCKLRQRDAEIEALVAELKRLPDKLRWISDNASHHSSAHWLKTQLYGLAREYETGYINIGTKDFYKINTLVPIANDEVEKKDGNEAPDVMPFLGFPIEFPNLFPYSFLFERTNDE